MMHWVFEYVHWRKEEIELQELSETLPNVRYKWNFDHGTLIRLYETGEIELKGLNESLPNLYEWNFDYGNR